MRHSGHTLATELLGEGASFEEVADVLGNTSNVVRQHYAKWSVARQERISMLLSRVFDTPVIHEKTAPAIY
jgi:site-specific recombinase XerD